MKTKKINTLSLNKRTIVNLEKQSMAKALGGDDFPHLPTDTCKWMCQYSAKCNYAESELSYCECQTIDFACPSDNTCYSNCPC